MIIVRCKSLLVTCMITVFNIFVLISSLPHLWSTSLVFSLSGSPLRRLPSHPSQVFGNMSQKVGSTKKEASSLSLRCRAGRSWLEWLCTWRRRERTSGEDSRHLPQQGVVSHAVARHRRRRPLEAWAGQQHVPYQGLDGGLADEPHEEELLDDGGGDCAEGGESEQQLSKPGWLVRVLGAAVLLQRALRLLLQLLHNARVRQATSILIIPMS